MGILKSIVNDIKLIIRFKLDIEFVFFWLVNKKC